MKLLNKNLISLLALAVAVALPTTFSHAHDNGRYHDHQNDRGRRGQVQTITLDRQDLRGLNQRGILGLRRALKDKMGNNIINQNTKLVSVDVKGRATGGMSEVALKVGGYTVDSARLRNRRCNPERGNRCRDNRRRSSVTLYNDSRNSQGAWKLTADVDTRIKQVTVTIKKRRTQRENKVSLGTAKITKVIGRTKVFHAKNYRINSVTVKAKSNSLDIIDVVVNYRDGSYKVLRRLGGHLSKNRTKSVKLPNSKSVASITVDAVSDDILGSSGRLEVIVGVLGPEPRPRPRPRRH